MAEERTKYYELEDKAEDELNNAFKNLDRGENEKLTEDEKIAALTVNDLLEQLKTDEFEKMYISTASQSSSKISSEISSENTEKIKSLAEYELENMQKDKEITQEEKTKLKAASNFYLIPHTVNHKYSVGNTIQTSQVEIYTINDVEGNSLYNVIDDKNITLSNDFRNKIKSYLEDRYPNSIASGYLNEDDVIEHFTPHSMNEMYDMLGKEEIISVRFLPDRIDEYAKSKGIQVKSLEAYDKEARQAELEGQDNLTEEKKVEKDAKSKDKSEEQKEDESLEEPEEEAEVKEKEDKEKEEVEEEKEEPVPDYVEKIAMVNHVKPAVVNTRVIENFEKVQEDTGIPLKGIYQRGQVVAVRIPYKLGYRTFLADKNTGLAIDGKGRMDSRPGKLYDYDEIEDYFRFKIRPGRDGGDAGKPLRYDEGRDYTTYIDKDGELKEKKFINNGKQKDMLREERERYLAEVEEADNRLKDAIEEYQKKATHENYEKVRAIIKEKVAIDNKYNALDEQREVTKQTSENAIEQVEKKKDDDGHFPSLPDERSLY